MSTEVITPEAVGEPSGEQNEKKEKLKGMAGKAAKFGAAAAAGASAAYVAGQHMPDDVIDVDPIVNPTPSGHAEHNVDTPEAEEIVEFDPNDIVLEEEEIDIIEIEPREEIIAEADIDEPITIENIRLDEEPGELLADIDVISETEDYFDSDLTGDDSSTWGGDENFAQEEYDDPMIDDDLNFETGDYMDDILNA